MHNTFMAITAVIAFTVKRPTSHDYYIPYIPKDIYTVVESIF